MINKLCTDITVRKPGKIYLFLLCLFSVFPAVQSAENYAQATLLSLNLKNTTVKNVLSEIENQSEYIFFYSTDVLDVDRVVSLEMSGHTLEEILNTMFEKTNNTYRINDRQVFILSKKEKENPLPSPAQAREQWLIKGVVVDQAGESVIGANILLKDDPGRGVVTNVDGEFSISVPSQSVLLISYVGYVTQEIVVRNDQPLHIVLPEDTQLMEEVVVVGFGTQKKASVVGSVQTVKPRELRSPSASLSNSFAGKIAGVVAVQRSGEPGADGASFWIRGVSTFAEATSPLIFIDGVESSTGDMNALSPEVIEGFSILKDASATALYGARGANGVMLITTRSGEQNERARINIRVQNTFSAPTQMIKLANGIDYMNAYNYALLNRTPDATPRFSEEKILNTMNGTDPTVYPNVDWQDYLFKDFSSNQIANLNVSGGTQKVIYFLSANIHNENGILKKDPLNKYDNNIRQFRLSFQGNIGAQLTATTKVNLRINSQIINYSGSSASTGDIYSAIFEAPPVLFLPVYPSGEADHTQFGNMDGGPVPISGTNLYRNPYAMMVSGYSNKDESTVTTSFDVDQDLKFILPGLRLKGLVSFKNYSHTNVKRSFTPYYYTVDTFEENPAGGYDYTLKSLTKGTDALSTQTSTTGDRLLNFQASLDYNRTFNYVHDVGAMFVYLQRDYNTNNPENDFYKTLPTRNQGIAGRLTYGYDSRYLAEFNFGYNGSENFQEGHRFGFFPSAALGYNISNESFFAPLTDVISNLKIRGSVGLVGNSFTDPRFPYLTFITLSEREYFFGNNWQTSQKGPEITKYGATGARWEKGVKSNLGIDLNLFNSLNLAVDVFQEVRRDIFMQRRIIPAETGITGDLNPYANLGKVKNRGLDISVDYNKMIKKDLILSARGSFTLAKNELLEKDEPLYPENEWYRTEIGKPLNCYTGLIAEGLFKDEEDIANSPEQTFSANYKPGDIKYKDLNGDGKIDANDKTIIGNPTVPQIVYGFGATVQWKRFDFSVFFQGVAKTSIMMENIHPFNSDQSTLFDFIAKDYWTEDNPDAGYPRLVSNVNSHNNFQTSTYWLRNGAFLRLKNMEMGYTYRFARLFVTGQNLLTFSPFKHWDPELGSGRGLKYPNLRVATIGVQMTF